MGQTGASRFHCEISRFHGALARFGAGLCSVPRGILNLVLDPGQGCEVLLVAGRPFLLGAFDAPPPVLIQVGSDEALLDDARRMADVLGDAAQLRIWSGVPHVWQIFDGYIPEARAALREMAEFVQTSFAMASR